MGWSTARPAPKTGARSAFPALVRLGKQAREDGASQSENVVGDVVEALIGALFLDGGIEAAERFILRPVGARPRRPAPGAPASQIRAPGARRRERLQGAASMKSSSRTGAHHAPKFTIRVSVPKLGEATAEGTSKQEAETAAAAALLNKLQ